MLRSIFKKVISVFLVFAMVLEVASSSCYALDPEEKTISQPESVEDPCETTGIFSSAVIGESVSRRSEHAKGFRLKDGSDAVFLYPFSVYEKNEDGVLIEIDNTLVEGQDPVGDHVYFSNSVSKKTVLYNYPSSGRFLDLDTKEGRISWGLLGNTSVTEAEYKHPEIEDVYSALQPKSVGDILYYKSVFPDIDIRLQLIGNDTEENVILNTPAAVERAANGLSYRLSLTGYKAELNESKVLLIPEDCDEAEYEITASYMEDADGNGCRDIQILLVEDEPLQAGYSEGSGVYTVTIYPSEEWLFAPERTYPITIDPTIAQRTSTSVLRATTVTSVASYDPQYICGTQHVGNGYYYGKMRTALQFDLPTQVTEADMVINAGIIAKQRGYSGNTGESVIVNAHRITTTATIGWNFKWATLDGHYEELVLDSQALSSSTSGSWVSWDITKAVKDWYLNGGNHGIALVSENEETAYKYIGFISPYDTGVSSVNYPIISITYLNQEGLESYLSYHSAGNEESGIIDICDFNGNMIYTYDDISLSGEYMPLSIQHVFNHSQRNNSNYVSSNMHYGNGFRLNLSQKISSITDSTLRSAGYWYTLTDADGTVHYFRLKSGTGGTEGSVYEKEFETTTTLSKSASGYTLDYNSDLVYSFNSTGLLTSIQDRSNNKSMELIYTSYRLTKVRDGAGREATFTYDSNGYLTKITDPAGRETTYTYLIGYLIGITSPYGRSVGFTYSGGKIVAVSDVYGSGLQIGYYTNTPFRVQSITETGSSSGEGGRLTFEYGGGETTVTDRNGYSETYQFDNAGHTVCVKDPAGNALYGSYGNTDDNNKHSLSLSSDLQGTVRNYLRNHDFEWDTLSPWSVFKNSDGNGSFAFDTAQKYMGQKSLKVISTATTGYYGVSQTINVAGCKGKDVTLSVKLKVSDYAPGAGDPDSCIIMRAWYQNASQVWTVADPVYHTGTCEWKNLTTTFHIPQDAYSETILVRFYFYHSSGTAYLDCIQAELGAVANRYNLLENAHFRESIGSTSAEGWVGNALNASTDKIVTGLNGQGFGIAGETDAVKYIKQTLNISGNQGDSYVFGVWGKADAIKAKNDSPHLTSVENRYCGVVIRFYKPDGTFQYVTKDFEAKTSEWQYLSGSAVSPCAYTKIEYLLCYCRQKNTIVFDDAQFYREGFGDILTYDSSGRVTKSTDCMGRETTYAYVPNRPEVASITYPDGSTSTYTYHPDTHKLLTQTDSNGKTVTHSYDENWNNKSISMTSGNLTLNSVVKEFGTGGYVTKETDPFGNQTQYSYTANKGLLASVTEPGPNGSVVTSYTYNANNDLLTGLTKGSSSVSYSYSNRRLTSLSHSGGGTVTYNLTYDQFGTRTAVKVGTQNLASYTYAANNGKLTRTTYGNGAYTEPVYDPYDRQTGVKYNGTLKYKWHYGADGRIGLEEDLVNNDTWRYLYDKSGNLTSVIGSNGTTIENTYDASGKALAITMTDDVNLHKTEYSYSDTSKFLTGIRFYSRNLQIGQLNISYDGFERASRTLKISDLISLETTYSYMSGAEPGTTTLIPSTMTTAGPGWSSQFSYTYDSMGNIATVSNGGNTTRYVYDSLNQLTREDNQAAGKSWVYSYDTGGNITSAKEYAYTTGTLGTALSTKSYSYGDSNWKYKLTSYDGSTITYDAIGNPLSYRGMSFIWDAGRQLASVTNGGTTTTYKYNSSGIRTSKTVGSTTTNYTLAGTQVLKATTGSNYVLYYYDESGSPVAFRARNGSTIASYYYVKDLQGDIVAITDSSGAKVVEYTYDAWGKVLSITGSLASTIGATNPYRYRGYWFDTETGLYYLQSRYYDPQTGRFINADILVSTGQGVLGCNMFAYCLNNPVSGIDSKGYFVFSALVGSILGGMLAGALSSAVSCIIDSMVFHKELSTLDVLKRVAIGLSEGALSGALGASGLKNSVKACVSLGVGIIEGVNALIQTDGTLGEKIQNGVLSMGLASLTMYASSLEFAGLSDATKIVCKSTTKSTALGLVSVAGMTAVKLTNNNLQSKQNSAASIWFSNRMKKKALMYCPLID